MSWSFRHLGSSVGILNLCHNLGIKKTIYLNSKSKTEMKFICFSHISQSFSIHQAIWSGLLDDKRMSVASKSGHFCSDLQHHRGPLNKFLCQGQVRRCFKRLDMKCSDGWSSDQVLHDFNNTWISVRVMWLWSLWTAITGPFWPQMTLDQAHVSPWVSHYLRPCLD